LQSRDQKTVEIFRVDTSNGSVTSLYRDEDAAWVELVGGVPALAHNSQLVTCADRDGVRSLLIDGVVVTPNSLQVRSVLSVGAVVKFAANDLETPWFLAVWQYDLTTKQLRCITPFDEVCSATANDNAVVVRSTSLRSPRASFHVIAQHGNSSHELRSFSEEMLVSPNVSLHTVGPNNIPVAILAPRDGAQTKLPVLFDPYGGPHAQRVVASQLAFATSQWFADQGFIVVVADGRGTPGKGSNYERAVLGDLATPVLDDQVAVLDALFTLAPRADVSRVAIRGWSFGGYLAALAVLRRPDKFHCAVAGAPVTDWLLYDTHYTERYLGNPATNDAPYEANSLMNDTHGVSRPLLLIHGLADDNVVAAHTLRLSSALLASGKDHEVLPLSGVTHMTPQEIVAENLLLHQLTFINRSLPSAQ
jgi:dipeptidyl-peptidase-4